MVTDSLSSPPRPPTGRKAFRRSQVPLAERVTSLVIVGLLGIVGAAIWIQGRIFNPDLYSLSEAALESTKAAINLPDTASPMTRTPAAAAAPAAVPTEEGYEEVAGQAAAGSPVAQPIEIPGTKPMGETEFYSADTLYEKINGRAPAYLDFGFQHLRCRSFSLPDGSYADVHEYRMDSPVNAFGIFALERDPAGKPLDFVADGYSGEMGYFFRQGDRYVQVIASDQKPGTLALAQMLSEHLAKEIPANDAGLGARRLLPAAGILPESVTYIQENAHGQGFLKEVFQADYQFDGKAITFFLMVTTPESAAKAWDEFLAFSGRYGGKADILPDIAGAKVFQAQNFGKWKLIYLRDGEIGGVVDAPDPDAARAFLEKLLTEKLQ